VLQGTVAELHLADKYDVTKLIKAANLCKEDIQRSHSAFFPPLLLVVAVMVVMVMAGSQT